MSQHLIDGGQRISAGPEDRQDRERDEPPRDVGGNGQGRGSAHDHEGRNGGGGRSGGEGRTGRTRRAGGGRSDEEGHTGDPTLRALDALSDALRELIDDQRLLERRLRELHRQRSDGRAWRDILAEEVEKDAPGTMQVVSRMLARLAKASGALRKELVDTLRHEGVSIPAIAKLFGVTHQRVSNLLRKPPE